MATFAELSARINDVFRDFVINGVPASGGWEPRKLEIRAIINEIVAAIAAGSFAEPPNWASTLANVQSRLETLDVIVDQAGASADQARDARDGALAIYGSIAAVQGAVAQAQAALAEMLDFAEGAPEAASIISKLNRNGGNADDEILEALPFIHPKTGSVARSVRERLSEIVSVKDFGAVGDGITRDDLAFGKALLGGNVNVFVPAGTYLFLDTVRLYANTTIVMHPKAVIMDDVRNRQYCFVNGEIGNNTYATGYNGDGNIVIQGGTIDHGIRAAKEGLTCAFAMGHARNVRFESVTFKNGYSSHYLEINACQHVRIQNCRFLDHAHAGDFNREDINIDYAFSGGFEALFGAFDGTTCDDVVMFGNVHDNTDLGSVGVGTHSIPPLPTFHTNIHVVNCFFRNMNDIGVTASGWKDSTIRDSFFENMGDAFVRARAAENVHVTGNTARGMAQRTGGAALFFDGAKRCLARDNDISNAGYTAKYTCGIDINGPSEDNFIWTRGIVPGSYQTLVTDAAHPGGGYWEAEGVTALRTWVNGALYQSLGDDFAQSFNPGLPQGQGLLTIATNSGTSPRVEGLVFVRTTPGATALCSSVATLTDAKVVYTTGALTGTTGTDGNITVSATADGLVHIENRSGVRKLFFIQPLGGHA